ncbi:heavy metal sensor histidine kinase [Marinobacter sp. VGCF2001]|uniref:heavy metal sensor histidine kinase n=1 Tax=Marinobacter sp. VGCF2001 TaxID=3417189 RepID=UPI003CECB693
MRQLSLSQRLALMFAAISLLTLGTIGFLLYGSLAKELAWRDDQTLLGRLERMEALLTNIPTIAELESQPQLYANMLGNTENVLWVMNADGEVLIEINPPNIPVPPPARNAGAEFFTHSDPVAFRAVRINTTIDGQSLTLIAGRTLAERNQMLAGYRATLWWVVTVGTLICALLGWLISQRALAPVRQISETLSQIRTNSLDVRLDVTDPAPEIRQLQNRLNGMIERLETGFEQLSRFSEDLAHEMRTPLHTLIGQTQQSLSQPRSKEEYEALLLSNLEEHERLSRVINSMLFLARTEHSEAPAAAQALDLPPLVDQLFDYFADIAADAQITLVNETSGQLMASRDMVQRALANLMDNALR